MALTNYSDLQQAVTNFINNDTVTSIIPDFITLAESRIANDVVSNDLHFTTTLTVDAATESLPDDFKSMIRANLGSYASLDYMPPDSFHATYASTTTGRPIAFTVEGNTIHFAPAPDSTYTMDYTYVARPDLATDTTNRLMTINPNIYLFGALCEAADYLGDDEAFAKYELKYQAAVNSINSADQFKGATAIYLDGVV